MKTSLTILTLSLAAACAAATGLAQQSGFTSGVGASGASTASRGKFQEVDVSPEADEAPGAYVHPYAGSGCVNGSCYDNCCNTGCCTSCGCGSCCCKNPFAHRSGLFAEFMFLRPRDTEIAFAVPGTFAVGGAGGPPALQIPQGTTLSLNPDHQPAYRVGGAVRISDEMSVRLSYTDFESETLHGGTLDAGLIGVGNSTLFPLLLHPQSLNAANVGNITAAGRYDIDYEAVDLDTRLLLWNSQTMAINALAGARWTQLDQDVLVGYDTSVVQVNSRFSGIGSRFGLDGEYRSQNGFGGYASGVLNLMFGNDTTRTRETHAIAQAPVFTDDEVGRLAPVLEFEFGVQWVSRNERLRFKGGYMSSQWFNIITPRDYINGIRNNQFDDFSDSITFDGFTAAMEVTF